LMRMEREAKRREDGKAGPPRRPQRGTKDAAALHWSLFGLGGT
jgi:hypothetical protein